MKTANQAWLENLNIVYESGHSVGPRGFATKEIIDHNCVFDMNYPICHHQSRKLSYKFMAAEAYWITSGSMFAEDIAPYNKHIGQFSDDQYIFNGNYGVPFIHQVESVIQTLKKDKNSRQAVMTIWRPNPIQSKDYPCTISLMFIIRNGKMHTKVSMRSQDLWLGQPYDFFNFTMMTLRVLTGYNAISSGSALGNIVELGSMHWSGFSTHIYERNFSQVEIVNDSASDKVTNAVNSRCLTDWTYVAKSLLACRDNVDTSGLNVWNIRPIM